MDNREARMHYEREQYLGELDKAPKDARFEVEIPGHGMKIMGADELRTFLEDTSYDDLRLKRIKHIDIREVPTKKPKENG